MTAKEQLPKKFRGERPIYLNETNTGFKTAEEVILAVEQLRERNWLCAYSNPDEKKARPFHMSFNDEKDFAEFKKDASALNIVLKNPIIKSDDMGEPEEEPIIKETKADKAHSTYQDSKGRIHIES